MTVSDTNKKLPRRTSGGAHVATVDAKKWALQYLREGRTVEQSMDLVGRSIKAYKYWRTHDEVFKREVDHIRAMKARKVELHRGEQVKDFEDFCLTYLNMRLFPHQLRWIDIIEGREPRDLHPSMIYEPGDSQYVLINTPPEFAKSMTLTVSYVTYRLCLNPDERVVVVSATEKLAKQFMYAIKQRLTHPRYAKLQLDFAPPEGFNGPNAIWQSEMVYFDGQARDGMEKDPNLQAIGFGGQIYGTRATMVVCDDVVTLRNFHRWEEQRKWLTQEVLTRMGPGGLLLICGTRVDAIDLYKVLRDPEMYPDRESPYTYLAQPAVLEYGDKPEDWVTLWPRSDRPWPGSKRPDDHVADENGLYPRWSGHHLARRRRTVGDERIWALVYQQMDVAEDAIFPAQAVRECVNGRRNHGLLDGDNEYHRRSQGMAGLYVVCSMDPAMAGDTATICYAVDVKTGDRFVLDAHRMTAPRPSAIKELIREWTDKYSPMSWVIEKNAFQLFLTRDEEVRDFLALRGCAMVEHYSGSNKVDPDFGVASLAPLFTEGRISLPSAHNCEGVRALVEQLVIWRPGVKPTLLKQDLPMALWFAELKVREVMEQRLGRMMSHSTSKYLPRYRKSQQFVVQMDHAMGMEQAWEM